MDRKDRERELVSTLLVELTPATVTGEEAGWLSGRACLRRLLCPTGAPLPHPHSAPKPPTAHSLPFSSPLHPSPRQAADQVSLGFRRLLDGLDDLSLDCPDAGRLMGLFLGERGPQA